MIKYIKPALERKARTDAIMQRASRREEDEYSSTSSGCNRYSLNLVEQKQHKEEKMVCKNLRQYKRNQKIASREAKLERRLKRYYKFEEVRLHHQARKSPNFKLLPRLSSL